VTGTALADFNDFVEGTGPTYVTGPKSLINEAVKNTYWFGRLIQGAKAKKKMIQGGANLRESIIFQDNGTFETYLPGANHDWKNPQRLNKIQVEWRYTLAHMAWVEQEILNNEIVSYGTDDAKFHEYVNIRNEKETLMWTAKWNGLEDLLWAQPNVNTMEATDGTEPNSIPVFINQDTDGLWGAGHAGSPTGDYTGSTVEGLDPTASAVNSRFTPQTATYSTLDNAASTGLFPAFDDMFMDVQFDQPPTMKMYWEDPRYNKQMIVTTKAGRKNYMGILRTTQDHFIAGAQDPAYPDPMFNGIPVSRASTLETATLYEDAVSGAVTTEDDAAGTTGFTGPRYYWVNAEYLYPVFHAQRYFYKHEVTKHHNVPDTWVCPVATWYNLICTSRQRQGIIYPNGNV